ncbi:MAG: hypothetical protein LCH79_20600 [Proteobacteria bacterium]|nr:hypothetical protein [Pseudomonadota bacterium]
MKPAAEAMSLAEFAQSIGEPLDALFAACHQIGLPMKTANSVTPAQQLRLQIFFESRKQAPPAGATPTTPLAPSAGIVGAVRKVVVRVRKTAVSNADPASSVVKQEPLQAPSAEALEPRSIKMKSFESRESHINVVVDMARELGRGGFGSVYEVVGDLGLIAKRNDMRVDGKPAAISAARARIYQDHVRVALESLKRAKTQFFSADSETIKGQIRKFVDEFIDNSLSSHYSYEYNQENNVDAVWFLQRQAEGKDLRQHFKDDRNVFDFEDRLAVARDFLTRMRTLRRGRLVHLDCTVDNIRVDKKAGRLVLIDLDGCGVEQDADTLGGARAGTDTWRVAPMTLGKKGVVRRPPWYPQAGLKCGPKDGNYLFAERWVALDTIIRILTWGEFNILSWLPGDVRASLAAGYGEVEKACAAAAPIDVPKWVDASTEEIRRQWNLYGAGIKPVDADFWLERGHPACLAYFSSLAQDAYFDPRRLSGERVGPSKYRSMYDEFLRQIRSGA